MEKPKKPMSSREYKKLNPQLQEQEAPFLSDYLIEWIIKAIISTLLFTLFYQMEIDRIELAYEGDSIGFYPALFMMVLKNLFIADMIGHVGGYIVKWIFIRSTKYKKREKGEEKRWQRWLWQYLFYLLLRTIFFVIQLVSLLETLFMDLLSKSSASSNLIEFMAIFLSWTIISLIGFLISHSLANQIVK